MSNDKKHGRTIVRYPVGDVLSGNFQYDPFAGGQWKILFRSGEFYKGGVTKTGVRNGVGIQCYSNGDIYKVIGTTSVLAREGKYSKMGLN